MNHKYKKIRNYTGKLTNKCYEKNNPMYVKKC